MLKKADTRITDAGQCQRQAHQTWLRRMLCFGTRKTKESSENAGKDVKSHRHDRAEVMATFKCRRNSKHEGNCAEDEKDGEDFSHGILLSCLVDKDIIAKTLASVN